MGSPSGGPRPSREMVLAGGQGLSRQADAPLALGSGQFQAFLLWMRNPVLGFEWRGGILWLGWRGSGRQAGGRWLSRNPRSHFNNLFQN